MQIGTTSPAPRPENVRDLGTQFLSVIGAKPVLIWYNSQGERIELSGRVWHNWISKSANLLVNHATDPSLGSVTLDAAVHWKTLAIALGAWTANFLVNIEAGVEGADASDRETESVPDPDILITSRPYAAQITEQKPPWRDEKGRTELEYPTLIRVDTSNLGTEFAGEIDSLDIDFAADVRLEADAFTPLSRESPSLKDLIAELATPIAHVPSTVSPDSTSTASSTHGPASVSVTESGEHAVVLLDGIAPGRDPRQLAAVLAVALEVWQGRGTLVLAQAGIADVDRIAQMEGATARADLSQR